MKLSTNLLSILAATLVLFGGCNNYQPKRKQSPDNPYQNPPRYRIENFYEKEFLNRPKAIDPPYPEQKIEEEKQKEKNKRDKPSNSLEEALA